MFQPGFLGGGVVVGAKTDSGTTNGGTYQFGPAAVGRLMVAAIGFIAGGAVSTTGVTIGGVPATQVKKLGFAAGDTSEIWQALVPAGTSGVISVAASGAISGVGITVYALTGANATPFATNSTTGTSLTLNVPAGGFAIGVVTDVHSGATTFTWTGLNKDTDFAINAGLTETSGASFSSLSAQTLNISATPSVASSAAICVASWGQ